MSQLPSKAASLRAAPRRAERERKGARLARGQAGVFHLADGRLPLEAGAEALGALGHDGAGGVRHAGRDEDEALHVAGGEGVAGLGVRHGKAERDGGAGAQRVGPLQPRDAGAVGVDGAQRGQRLLHSVFGEIAVAQPSLLPSQLSLSAARGLLGFKQAGGVVEFDFTSLLTADERSLADVTD